MESNGLARDRDRAWLGHGPGLAQDGLDLAPDGDRTLPLYLSYSLHVARQLSCIRLRHCW